MSKRMTLVAALIFLPTAFVHGQQLAPAVWFGVPSAQDERAEDERFEVEVQGGRTIILWAPYGKKPVSWGTVTLKSDGAFEFDWLRDLPARCVMRRDNDGQYSGTCAGSGRVKRGLTLTTNEPSHGAALAVTDVDFRILARARERLSGPSVWNRRDERACEDDLANNSWSLFCALYQASLDVAGTYMHRRPVTTEARAVVAELTKGRRFEHRLRDFNNLDSTTFFDITTVFDRTYQRLEGRRTGNRRLANIALHPTPTASLTRRSRRG